jgi:hypothetical protein
MMTGHLAKGRQAALRSSSGSQPAPPVALGDCGEVGCLRLLPRRCDIPFDFAQSVEDGALADIFEIIPCRRREPCGHVETERRGQPVRISEPGIVRAVLPDPHRIDAARQAEGEEIKQDLPVLLKAPCPQGIGCAGNPAAPVFIGGGDGVGGLRALDAAQRCPFDEQLQACIARGAVEEDLRRESVDDGSQCDIRAVDQLRADGGPSGGG